LQDKLEINVRELKESYNVLIESNKELKENNRESKENSIKFQSDIETKLEKSQEHMKTDLKTETEKLIQRTDREIQNSDVVLRQQGEYVEQVMVENKVEKLHAQTTELRELDLTQINNDIVPHTLNSENENIINSKNVEVQTTICSPLGIVGNVSGAISTDSNLDSTRAIEKSCTSN
jgi:hypothetical protein